MTQTLKCGRITYDLVDGDCVMDNGSCLQFTTRRIRKGFSCTLPRVSKKEFERYKAMPEVRINNTHRKIGQTITYWCFESKNEDEAGTTSVFRTKGAIFPRKNIPQRT